MSAKHHTDSATLLPCPFCGGAAIYEDFTRRPLEPGEKEIHHVRCGGPCRGHASYSYYTPEKAVIAWNTRATDQFRGTVAAELSAQINHAQLNGKPDLATALRAVKEGVGL